MYEGCETKQVSAACQETDRPVNWCCKSTPVGWAENLGCEERGERGWGSLEFFRGEGLMSLWADQWNPQSMKWVVWTGKGGRGSNQDPEITGYWARRSLLSPFYCTWGDRGLELSGVQRWGASKWPNAWETFSKCQPLAISYRITIAEHLLCARFCMSSPEETIMFCILLLTSGKRKIFHR